MIMNRSPERDVGNLDFCAKPSVDNHLDLSFEVVGRDGVVSGSFTPILCHAVAFVPYSPRKRSVARFRRPRLLAHVHSR